MPEFATTGKGNAALATGVTGLSIAGLQAIAPGGILSGIFGPRPPFPPPPPPGPDPYTVLLAENTLLKSNQYTDQSTLQTKIDLARQEERITALKEQQVLYNQIIDGKIALSTQSATAAFQQTSQAIATLQYNMSQIAQLFVPAPKVTPLPQPWIPEKTSSGTGVNNANQG